MLKLLKTRRRKIMDIKESNQFYQMIPETLLTDSTLNAKEFRLLAYLLTRPDNFRFIKKHYISMFPENRSSVDSTVKSLKEKRLLCFYPVRANGHIAYYDSFASIVAMDLGEMIKKVDIRYHTSNDKFVAEGKITYENDEYSIIDEKTLFFYLDEIKKQYKFAKDDAIQNKKNVPHRYDTTLIDMPDDYKIKCAVKQETSPFAAPEKNQLQEKLEAENVDAENQHLINTYPISSFTGTEKSLQSSCREPFCNAVENRNERLTSDTPEQHTKIHSQEKRAAAKKYAKELMERTYISDSSPYFSDEHRPYIQLAIKSIYFLLNGDGKMLNQQYYDYEELCQIMENVDNGYVMNAISRLIEIESSQTIANKTHYFSAILVETLENAYNDPVFFHMKTGNTSYALNSCA